ncbi:MAG: hypothetical protein IVW55_17675 [Chloroflexi bacterium]|nr:hypothetical protein [Chloroflexota bacterium]
MMGGMMEAGIYWWLFAGSAILVVIGIILLLAWLFSRATREETALVILQRRYAQGEIGPDEYARVRSDLLPNASEPAGDMENKENTG